MAADTANAQWITHPALDVAAGILVGEKVLHIQNANSFYHSILKVHLEAVLKSLSWHDTAL